MDDTESDDIGGNQNVELPVEELNDTTSVVGAKNATKSTIVSNAVDLEKCPCGGSKSCYYVRCDICNQEWHQDCVFLSGLDKKAIKSLKHYACLFCSYLPDSVSKTESHDKPGLSEIGSIVQREVAVIIPAVVEQVTAAVKKTVTSVHAEEVVKQANSDISRSWAEITAGNQKALITQVVEQSSNVALTKSMQLIDSNLTEQRKRGRNVIITKVPENENPKTEDLQILVSGMFNGEIDKKDILVSKRLGVYNSESVSKPRPIFVTMRYEDDANYCHNFGKGFRIRREKYEAWANPDLTQTEREVKYNERKARREAEEEKDRNKEDAEENSTNGPKNGKGVGQ